MRKKRNLKKKTNINIAIVFTAFVVFIVTISLISKILVVLRQSQFDDQHRFTTTVSNTKNIEIISFSPIARTIGVLKLSENLDPKTINKFLAIPVDGFVFEDSLDLNQKVDSLFLRMILDSKKLKTNLTIVDLLRLFALAKKLPENGINEIFISQDLSPSEIDGVVSQLINDETIQKERKRIEIINGTNVSGLGNRLARLITNMGGDVIIVATGNRPEKVSTISYNDDKSYTVERLAKILNFKSVNVQDKGIADITIVVGEDSVNSSFF